MFTCFPQYSKKQLLLYVRPSVLSSAWNNLALTGRTFVKFDIVGFFKNVS
jgi:hypothetical protein